MCTVLRFCYQNPPTTEEAPQEAPLRPALVVEDLTEPLEVSLPNSDFIL
jgi:hypothetical protein